MPIALVTDSTHYLPRALAEQCRLHEVSLYIHRNGGAQPEREIQDYDAYYRELAVAKPLPTTSQPSIGDFLSVWEPLLDAGDEILSMHLSGGLSGTVGAAEQARAQLGARAGRVQVIDSGTAAGALGLMLMAAAHAIADGATIAAAITAAQQARAGLHFLFAVDTLEYLRRGGRIGGAQAWLGSALQIKPILSLGAEIEAVERVRTSRRAFARLVRLMEALEADGSDAWVVQHTQAGERAQALVERGREIFQTEPVFVSEIGPVIGTHIGPGLLGVGALPAGLL